MLSLLPLLLMLHASTLWNSEVSCWEMFSNQFYEPYNSDYDVVKTLPDGDSEFLEWHVDSPIHFYSEMYDTLYVSLQTRDYLYLILS